MNKEKKIKLQNSTALIENDDVRRVSFVNYNNLTVTVELARKGHLWVNLGTMPFLLGEFNETQRFS